jgi:hypothetical protein
MGKPRQRGKSHLSKFNGKSVSEPELDPSSLKCLDLDGFYVEPVKLGGDNLRGPLGAPLSFSPQALSATGLWPTLGFHPSVFFSFLISKGVNSGRHPEG